MWSETVHRSPASGAARWIAANAEIGTSDASAPPWSTPCIVFRSSNGSATTTSASLRCTLIARSSAYGETIIIGEISFVISLSIC
jgi:hypothetical protein